MKLYVCYENFWGDFDALIQNVVLVTTDLEAAKKYVDNFKVVVENDEKRVWANYVEFEDGKLYEDGYAGSSNWDSAS